MKITLTIESFFPCLISFLEHIEDLQEQHSLKIISIVMNNKNAQATQVCSVVLNEVSSAVEFLYAISKQIKALNTIHCTPIQIIRFETSPAAAKRSSAHES
ncbi:MAG: hypothetical protein RBR45_08050 [Pseudomonas sp.]|jgi:hypothetical protein|nr:hypothetical protein [Pseudomonas sp.]